MELFDIFLLCSTGIVPKLSTYVEYIDKTDFATTYLALTQSAGQRILQAFNGSSTSSRPEVPAFFDHPLLAHFKEKALNTPISPAYEEQ